MSDGDFVLDSPIYDAVAYYARHPEQLDYLVDARERGGTAHAFKSTACIHGHHDHCRSGETFTGVKLALRCEFCGSPCVCPCHGP